MRVARRTTAVAALLLTTATLALAGCAAVDDWSEPHPKPSPVGALGPGFEPSASPSPEATIHPRDGSWSDVAPSPGYRVVLLTAGDEQPVRTIAASVRRWAEADGVSLKTVRAGRDLVGAIVEAMALKPDLVITAGNDVIDPLATVSANHLDQQFLTIGAEVAEPTANVTAVDWTGASFRGTDNGSASPYEPATFTPSRTDRAVRAGVASVLHGLTGIVLWIE